MSDAELFACYERRKQLEAAVLEYEKALAAKDSEIERLRGQLLLEQDRVKLLKEELDHLREVVRQLNDDKHLDAWEEGEG